MFAVNKKINFDGYQQQIRQKLAILRQNIEENFAKKTFLNFFISPKKLPSYYIWGPPGSGKTTLMRDFYSSVNINNKSYFHFNNFMRLVHENLRDIRGESKNYPDELIESIKRIIKDKKLLCFDEFQVIDIADAMLLSRIFTYLFENKVIIIFTSNSAPLENYKNGLQREVFIDFIRNVLLKFCLEIKLDSNIDYRLQYRKTIHKRYFISSEQNRAQIKEIIANLTKSSELKPRLLKVWGRDLIIKKTFDNIAVINFNDICKTELAASDYQAICQEFALIFLHNVPKFTIYDKNEMRRFMLFIDEVYENKAALIILAHQALENLYSEISDKTQFERVISRLNEIKSDEYWNNSKFCL